MRSRNTKGDWKGTVGVAEHLGSDTFLHVNVDKIGPVTVRAQGEINAQHGDHVYLTPDPGRIYRFDSSGIAKQ